MKKLKKGFKRIYVSVIFSSKEYGDFEQSTSDGKGIWFDIPISMNCEPIHIYQYEAEKLGEEILTKQSVIKSSKV